MAAKHGLKINQMDAVSAFLQGDLDEEIYIHQPDGANDGTPRVCKLKKAMYGLKQSGRQWNRELDKALKKFGLIRSKIDPCVYVQKSTNKPTLMVASYVDDLFIFWLHLSDLIALEDFLAATFKMKKLGPAKYCIGLRITRDNDGNYYLDQTQYIKDLLEKFNMLECKGAATPSDPNQRLSKTMSAQSIGDEENMANVPYQAAVGALLYLVQVTRPDIAFAVSNVSQFNNCYSNVHWTAVKRIMRYLKSTINFKLKYSSKCSDSDVIGYCDADFGGNTDTRKSCTGYVFKLQQGAISWASRRQPTVALSTSESEYMALAAATQEAIWLKQFGQQLGNVLPDSPIVINCDNQSAICLAKTDAYSARTKHIDIRYHFVREYVSSSLIDIKYVPTDQMPADALTKAVPGPKQLFCSTQMGLVNEN